MKTKRPNLIKTERIIFAGFGGQGIMLMGKLLAQAAMLEDKEVTWMPSYGAEVRGGTAHSMVIISHYKIASPVVSQPDSCIVMNSPSLLKFERKLRSGGLLIINTSLARDKLTRDDISVIRIPATEIATRLGELKVSNMVALGAYVAKSKVVSLDTIFNSLKYFIPTHSPRLLKLNEKAIREGARWVYGRSKG